jgi:uncharacterized protein (TIGR02328 family)
MLVSQWRELIAIKRQWEKGTLKHRLVSYVMDYDKNCFYNYITRLCQEMLKRNIKYQDKYLYEIMDFCECTGNSLYPMNKFNYPEHNDRYLMQCLYNLQEKADRGIISQEEWDNITYNVNYELYKGF